jgi:hypothetical protein
VWRPQWLWLLDICLSNSFLIWQEGKKDKRRRGHRRFREALTEQLLHTQEASTTTVVAQATIYQPSGHSRCRWLKRNYCEACKKQPNSEGAKGPGGKRTFGTELDPNTLFEKRIRGRRTQGGYQQCGKYLCVVGPCFDIFHSRKKQ